MREGPRLGAGLNSKGVPHVSIAVSLWLLAWDLTHGQVVEASASFYAMTAR